ncbi:Di-sulfide bridge nucleocytoplasmic transport domain-containing protein [Chlamydoabsidia padenii]|nr:Di-sulfide bridge nucleocytoplasmic transport domain-containing protein [Chlamydoabsidia padenii]
MASYDPWESSMDFEYQYSHLLPGNSFSYGKPEPSPPLEPATPNEKVSRESPDLFVSALDQTMSTQLGSISLADSPEKKNEQAFDQKAKDTNDEQNTTTAVVPYFRSLPTSPAPLSSDYDISNTNNDNHDTTINNDNCTPLFREEANTSYTPPATAIDRSTTMHPDQQRYDPHLYPTASFYHHDPVAHRTSLVNYISGMVQIGCQLVFFFFCLYIAYQFILALNEDVALKIQVYESEYMDKHFICEQEYHRNQCYNNNRPAMVEPCREWLQCLYTPAWIGKTKVLAETFAEIANGFVDTISLKTMVFGILVVIATLWFSSQGKHGIGYQPQHRLQH